MCFSVFTKSLRKSWRILRPFKLAQNPICPLRDNGTLGVKMLDFALESICFVGNDYPDAIT